MRCRRSRTFPTACLQSTGLGIVPAMQWTSSIRLPVTASNSSISTGRSSSGHWPGIAGKVSMNDWCSLGAACRIRFGRPPATTATRRRASSGCRNRSRLRTTWEGSSSRPSCTIAFTRKQPSCTTSRISRISTSRRAARYSIRFTGSSTVGTATGSGHRRRSRDASASPLRVTVPQRAEQSRIVRRRALHELRDGHFTPDGDHPAVRRRQLASVGRGCPAPLLE